ncbi:ABC transporter substrate-binding protein [Mycolicibacterium pulveris]|uniref:ABC transporter substrate-binding protein n=1 Tax=Mycolicibacterium pulveris TaxID=36813 RepID=UPI003CFB99BB
METLKVGTAVPLAPFNSMPDGGGLDIDLMTALAEKLGATIEFVERHSATDAIYEGLDTGEYDCVAAGAVVTPERETKARFVAPYLISGQALAVDAKRLPRVHSLDDLAGLTVGVRQGRTGQPIAERLVDEGAAAAVRVYDDASIGAAPTDLSSGACDAFLELAPVLTELVKPVPGVAVVARGLSVENIAVAVGLHNQALLSRLSVAQAELEDDGTLQAIRRKWLGNPYADQSLAVH